MANDRQTPGEAEAPILSIVGQLVALGPLRHDLVPLYQKWVNDLQVTRTIGLPLGGVVTREAEEAWYAGVATARDSAPFTIYERATLRPIGNTALGQIDHKHGTAVFGIMIGERDCWGKGYGTEATRLVLDFGFTVLGLHNILLTVYSFNERGIRAYLRAGFREIGRRREARWLAGQRYDVVYMDCLASEFESPVLARVIGPSAI